MFGDPDHFGNCPYEAALSGEAGRAFLARYEAMRDVLVDNEWSGWRDDKAQGFLAACPECERAEHEGHSGTCRYAAALRGAAGNNSGDSRDG
jgi:hypothetical protein